MSNDKLFGTLHTPLKPLHYTGLSTDSVEVIVDSKERTIEANVQPAVLDSIKDNAGALAIAKAQLADLYGQLATLQAFVDLLERNLIEESTTRELTDTSIDNRVKAIEDDYIETNYNIKEYVAGKIEDKIIEFQEGTLELETYAKKVEVEEQFNTLNQDIQAQLDDKVDESTFSDYQETVKQEVSDVKDLAQSGLNLGLVINEKLEVLEASIGPLPEDKTLKEEIFETFITRQESAEACAEVLQEVENKGYLTEQSLEGYATETYVNNSLANYYNKDDVNKLIDEIPIAEKVDLSNYYTKKEVDDKFESFTGGGGDVDLSNYYTKTQTQNVITDALSDITLISASLELIN